MSTKRISSVLYAIAALVLIVPMIITQAVESTFILNNVHTFFQIATAFVILGRGIADFKKVRESKAVPWISIGCTLGILLFLIGSIF